MTDRLLEAAQAVLLASRKYTFGPTMEKALADLDAAADQPAPDALRLALHDVWANLAAAGVTVAPQPAPAPGIDVEALARALHRSHYDLPEPERLGGGTPTLGGPFCDCEHDAAVFAAAYAEEVGRRHGGAT